MQICVTHERFFTKDKRPNTIARLKAFWSLQSNDAILQMSQFAFLFLYTLSVYSVQKTCVSLSPFLTFSAPYSWMIPQLYGSRDSFSSARVVALQTAAPWNVLSPSARGTTVDENAPMFFSSRQPLNLRIEAENLELDWTKSGFVVVVVVVVKPTLFSRSRTLAEVARCGKLNS